MSKEAAEKFVEAWEARDATISEALEGQDEALLDVGVLAGIAGGIGYGVTEEELMGQLEARRRRVLGEIDAAEMSDEDLSQVAGGGLWPKPCSSDYDPHDTCVYDDRCLNMWNYYPANNRCAFTYEQREECLHDDQCKENRHCYNPMYG